MSNLVLLLRNEIGMKYAEGKLRWQIRKFIADDALFVAFHPPH